jgi:ABC-type glycerol-3-phosphate transport system substrate-binding protein
MNLKKMLLISVILSMTITTTACNEKKPVAENAVIHWMIGAPTDQAPATFSIDKIYRDTILSFEKLNPTIKITIDYFPQTNDFDFMKMLKSDQSPDIVPKKIQLI